MLPFFPKRGSMGQCLGELDPDPTQPVGPTWFQLTPNLEASAGKCWFARRDLQAPPHQLLVAIAHDIGMPK